MIQRIAMLASICLLAMSSAAEDLSLIVDSTGRTETTWAADQIATLAAAHSPAANLLESERSALSASIDHEDAKQCFQTALAQQVLRDLACQERNRTAALGLTTFYQLVGLEHQQSLLEQVDRTLEQLLKLADKAAELEITDGNRSELEKQRYQIADQQAEAIGANIKLRIALAELIGRPFNEVESARLAPSLLEEPDQWSTDAAIALAMSKRCDLQAIDSLCRSLTINTLPVARQLLGALQPGLGIAIAIVSKKSLLAALHSDDNDHGAAELCHRRKQCTELRTARQGQIDAQVRLALIEQQTAVKQLNIARQQAELDSQLARDSIKAIELDQAAPGSDLRAALQQLQSQGKVIERQTAVAVAIVKVREATGIAF